MIVITLKDPASIRMLIAEQGESLNNFSKKIGISQGYLSQIISGKYNPSATVAHKIATGLGLNVEDLFLIKTIDISMGKEVF